jgi:hypothetical protein
VPRASAWVVHACFRHLPSLSFVDLSLSLGLTLLLLGCLGCIMTQRLCECLGCVTDGCDQPGQPLQECREGERCVQAMHGLQCKQ